jgi:hypothetical protein
MNRPAAAIPLQDQNGGAVHRGGIVFDNRGIREAGQRLACKNAILCKFVITVA